ncbi:MAG: YbjN domain-containing protein [Alphaproteobacteria bacterium]|nr:YbjN domain-containing protein [Alphaproteobacteria bacterium SS10]
MAKTKAKTLYSQQKFTLAVALGLAVLASPATASAQQVYEKIGGEQLAALMQDWGYRAELGIDEYGDPLIETSAAGTGFEVVFYDCAGEPAQCDSIMLTSGFDFQEGINPAVTNEWNLKHRFTRAYNDEEGDPIIELDYSLVGGVTAGNMKELFELWESRLGDFTDHIDW